MSVSEDEERDCKLAVEKNKIYIPLQDRSCLLERLHRSYTKHLRTAKLLHLYCNVFSGLVCTRTSRMCVTVV